jgi:hypothetical protein
VVTLVQPPIKDLKVTHLKVLKDHKAIPQKVLREVLVPHLKGTKESKV